MQRWLPARWSATSVSRRRSVAVTAVLLGIAAVAGLTALTITGRPDPERPPALPVASPEVSAGTTDIETTATGMEADEPLVISVVGKVAAPGLITVPAGARVADAIDQAGGADRDADLLTVNLARRLTDGEQLYVGVPVPPDMASSPREAGVGAAGGRSGQVDLNHADQQLLETLPGVGEVTAQGILDWRAENGRFTAVEQLREVDGIGEKRFARLRDEVTVG